MFGTIAKGSFSRVRYCTGINQLPFVLPSSRLFLLFFPSLLQLASDTNESFALRIIDRTKIEQEGLLETLKNEITIMKMLDHRCVVNVKDMLASNNRIFLVLDLMMGGMTYFINSIHLQSFYP